MFETSMGIRVWCITFGVLVPSIFGIQGYSPVSECDFCSVSIKLNFFFSSLTGAWLDGMVEISMTCS